MHMLTHIQACEVPYPLTLDASSYTSPLPSQRRGSHPRMSSQNAMSLASGAADTHSASPLTPCREEGFLSFWKGNGVNVVRVFPYAAAQLASNDSYKRLLADERHELTVARRLVAGACAGMTATALTHPLDTIRLRLALPNHPYKGVRPAAGLAGVLIALPNHPSKAAPLPARPRGGMHLASTRKIGGGPLMADGAPAGWPR